MSARRLASFVGACVLAACAWGASAGEMRPFVSGSMQEILAPRQGKAFILGLWSLNCTHCREDLALLADLKKQFPSLDLVLIAADSPEEAEAASALLRQYSLLQAEAWIFADPFTEKLRFEIDRKWRGELPRTYFYSPGGVKAVSGKLDPRAAIDWARQYVSR